MAMYREYMDAPRRRRLTVEDYYRMGEAGIFGPEERVELIDGEIIDMPPIGELHVGTLLHLDTLLKRAVGDRAMVLVQSPAVLGRYSAPQPDAALLRPRPDFYKSALPRSEDILLIIEVADTSLRYDRDTKAALYAQHGIIEYWLIDVRRKRLTRHRNPAETGYALVDEPDVRGPVEPAGLAGVRVDVAAVLEE